MDHLSIACGFTPAAILITVPDGLSPGDAYTRGRVTVTVPVALDGVEDAFADPTIGQYLDAGLIGVFAFKTLAAARAFKRLEALRHPKRRTQHRGRGNDPAG
jgi:hypothetical protein